MPAPPFSRDALRAVLLAGLDRLEEGGTFAADDRLGEALAALSSEARRHGLRAEQLLVLLKEAWRELPEAGAIPEYESRQSVLGRVIVLCLDDYYRASD